MLSDRISDEKLKKEIAKQAAKGCINFQDEDLGRIPYIFVGKMAILEATTGEQYRLLNSSIIVIVDKKGQEVARFGKLINRTDLK